jgi:hypothetical protein
MGVSVGTRNRTGRDSGTSMSPHAPSSGKSRCAAITSDLRDATIRTSIPEDVAVPFHCVDRSIVPGSKRLRRLRGGPPRKSECTSRRTSGQHGSSLGGLWTTKVPRPELACEIGDGAAGVGVSDPFRTEESPSFEGAVVPVVPRLSEY